MNIATGAFNCLRSSCGKQGHFVELARDIGFSLPDESLKKYRTLPARKIETKAPAIEYMASRGISKEVTEKYSITTQTGRDNILVFPFYNQFHELEFVKYRKTDAKKGESKEWCEKDTKPILFGMNRCIDFDTLVITEGQIDSLSLSECGIPNAVSVPSGAMGFTWLQHCWDWVNQFQRIVVFGDHENGKITLLDKLRSTLRVKVMSVRPCDYLFEKDANAILQKYGKQAIVHAVENAEIQEVEFVKRLSSVRPVDLASMPKIQTGINQIDRTIGGLMMGQVILLSGKRGEGKSTFMSQLVAEAADQGYATFVYSGELPDYYFKNWIDSQIAGAQNMDVSIDRFGDEYCTIPESVTKQINEWYHDKIFLFDNYAVDSDNFNGIFEVVETSIVRYDIKLVCIDNLMMALDDDPSTDIYRKQSMFVKSLSKLAKKYDVAIVLVAHPKKSVGDFSNDTVSGSADITNAVDVVMNYQRASPSSGCDSEITITKNRLNGKLIYATEPVELFYCSRSRRIKSDASQPPKVYGCFLLPPIDDFTNNAGLPF